MQQTRPELLKTWEEFNQFNHAKRYMSVKMSIKCCFLIKLVNNKITKFNNERTTD